MEVISGAGPGVAKCPAGCTMVKFHERGPMKLLSSSRFQVALIFLSSLLLVPGALLGQQPAQRILPKVLAPPSKPAHRSPCLPGFDPGLRRYVQSCKEFHGGEVPPDHLDRLAVAITGPAGAVVEWDLDAVEKSQFEKRLPHRALGDGLSATEEVEAGRRKWLAYRAAAAELTARHLADKPDAPAGKTEVNATSTDGDSPVVDTDLRQRLAGLKKSFFPVPEMALRWHSDGQGTPLTPPFALRLEVQEGELVRIAVRAVKPAPGFLWPDPVVWLCHLAESGDPEHGRVVAVSDDGTEGLPQVAYRAETGGLYRVIIAPYRTEGAGFAALEIEVEGVVQFANENTFFGGVVFRGEAVGPGELFFAGAAAGANERYHDALLALLPPPEAEPGGRYAASNNEVGTLPLLRAAGEVRDVRVIAGAFRHDDRPSITLYRSRLREDDGERADQDGDFLTGELETLLGTCDSADASAAGDCRSPLPQPATWHPRDTDNDGFSDFEELFGLRRCYATPGVPPLFDLTGCRKDREGRCAWECTQDDGLIADIPLSAMDGPDPTVHDVYVEYDFWQGANEPAGEHSIPAGQVESIRRAFEESYVHDGGPHSVPGGYPLRFHLYQDDAVPFPDLAGAAKLPALAQRSLFFDLFFTPDRKYTNTFHYVLGAMGGGGQSDVTGRAAIIGAGRNGSLSIKFIHEAGHLLGLLHNHDKPNPDHTPFHLSIMSYGYTHTMPPPIEWGGEFVPCTGSKNCGKYFKCAKFPGRGAYCAPDCGIIETGKARGSHFSRFSAGELQLPAETSEAGIIPETDYPEWFLPYLYCYTAGGKGTSHLERFNRFRDPACAGGRCVVCKEGTCTIDLDRDGKLDGAENLDIDRDGRLNEKQLADHDDRSRMIARGRRGLRVLAKRSIAAFYTGFTGARGLNLLPFPSVVHEHHGGYAEDVTNLCDETEKWSHCRGQRRGHAALFRGPASGDQGIEARVPPEFCLDHFRGLAFSMRVKPLQVLAEEKPVVLFDSPVFRLSLGGRPEKAEWIAAIREEDDRWTTLTLEDPGALGNWTRLTVQVKNRDSSALLIARRKTTRLTAEKKGLEVAGQTCIFSIGSVTGADSRFLGFIDDPMLLSGPVRNL